MARIEGGRTSGETNLGDAQDRGTGTKAAEKGADRGTGTKAAEKGAGRENGFQKRRIATVIETE
jgi:hypothetical protein